jgi:uncharacterized protein
MNGTRPKIGRITGGGIMHHVTAELDISSEGINVGATVMIVGSLEYFATVVDTSHPAREKGQKPIVDLLPPLLARRINRKTNKPSVELMLTMDRDLEGENNNTLRPASSLPPLYSPVYLPNEADIARLFGSDQQGSWPVGFTREQGFPVSINLETVFSRSAGVFGASGAGKSSITRVILSGLLKKNIASVLVLDCHNDYSYDDVAMDANAVIPGLKTIFPNQIKVFGLGKNARVRGIIPDAFLEISMDQIFPSDILSLSQLLNLRETSATTLSALYKSFGRNWLDEFLKMHVIEDIENEGGKKTPPPGSVAIWCKSTGTNAQAANALRSKLARLEALPYLVNHPTPNGIQSILSSLKSGKNVILSFADQENDLDYLLVSNLIARAVKREWTEDANHYRSTHESRLRHLIIVLEEAHKFLFVDSQSIFSLIARETRKSALTLLICDQRPSQIWDEVMSQLQVRISGWLGDDDDLSAILTGLSKRDELRKMMYSLRQSGEMLIAGYATATHMPFRLQLFTQEFVEKWLK